MTVEVYDFGQRLKELREQRNWTQVEAARKIGVQRSTMYKYEQNLSIPNIEILKNICIVFRVSADYVLGLTPVPAIPTLGLSNKNIKILTDVADALRETQKGNT